MSALEETLTAAIANNEIEGVVLQGRDMANTQYSKALGNRTLPDGTQKPLSTSDICFLASSTKLITTIAALQCCETGLLSLDGDLASKLPEVIKQGVLLGGNDEGKAPNIEPLRKPLTLRHMLTHSSGFIYHFMDPAMQQWRDANPAPTDASDVNTRFLTPLAFQPGESWAYGIGLDWTGYLVEQVTGMKLDDYFRKNILKPLGIPASEVSFFPVKEGMGQRMPELNPKDPKGQGLSSSLGNNVHGDVLTGCFGGQGGYASSDAYIAILQSILFNDGKLLKSESVAEMFKPQLEQGAKESLIKWCHGPFGALLAQNTTGSDINFGLGGLLIGEEDGGLGKNSLTWGGGCNSTWFINQTNKTCGFQSLQIGLPPDMEIAVKLKGVFKQTVTGELIVQS